jgi:carboxyl-terminal processing protease
MWFTRFRKPAALVAAVIAFTSWLPVAPTARAEAPVVAATAEANSSIDPAKLFDAVVDTIERRFVDVELLKTLDWQARAAAVRPSVVSAANAQEAVDLIRKLLSELKLSHTELTTPDEYRYYITLDAFSEYPDTAKLIVDRFWGNGPYYPGTGIFTTMAEGRHFIDGVLEGSPADKAGLKFGDEVVSVDGKPYSAIAAFRAKIGTVAEVAIRRTRDGEIRSVRLPVIPVQPSMAFADATKTSARIIERDGRRIGYIHIWSMKEAHTFHAALASIDPRFAASSRGARPGDAEKTLDALIIDMRGRVGGNMRTAGEVLDLVGTAQRPYWGERRSTAREDAPPTRHPPGRATLWEGPRFRGHSVLLIDHQTRSAGEILAFGYKRSLFGLVIGTQTAGAVTGGLIFPMPGGLLLHVAVNSMEFDGKPLEGVGVAPDVRVERPLAYAGGADPVLERAINHLAKSDAPHPMNGYGFTR